MDWAREGMAKTDSAKNKKMSFFIGLSPFGLLRAFRLEPKAKMTGRVPFAGLALFWNDLGRRWQGKWVQSVPSQQQGERRMKGREFGGARRNRTADKGFADLCLTTWRPRLSATKPAPTGFVQTCQSIKGGLLLGA